MIADEDQEENTFGVTRYQCMPSLISLQLMRNRLHLAYLGRKLMKWTALATGKELRRIVMKLEKVYQNFNEDMHNAFILLARCRYFNPSTNEMVREGVPRIANVCVTHKTKTTAGVKILKYRIQENETHPYEHLGISTGGQTIQEAKKTWLELLKRIILMVQLRTNYKLVEAVHKAANKKWKVLSKMIVPRIILSIRYIISELEEIEREDNFRLKRFKELKMKKNKTAEVEEEVCGPVCTICPLEFVEEFEPCVPCVPCESTAKDIVDEGLEKIMANIDDIIECKESCPQNVEAARSINIFLNSCLDLKSKIEEVVKTLGGNKSNEVCTPISTTKKSCVVSNKSSILEKEIKCKSNIAPPISDSKKSDICPKKPCISESSSLKSDAEDSLGYFESKYKEIIRISRLQNEDGTVTKEKKVVTVKTDRRNPQLPKCVVSNKASKNQNSACSSTQTCKCIESDTNMKTIESCECNVSNDLSCGNKASKNLNSANSSTHTCKCKESDTNVKSKNSNDHICLHKVNKNENATRSSTQSCKRIGSNTNVKSKQSNEMSCCNKGNKEENPTRSTKHTCKCIESNTNAKSKDSCELNVTNDLSCCNKASKNQISAHSSTQSCKCIESDTNVKTKGSSKINNKSSCCKKSKSEPISDKKKPPQIKFSNPEIPKCRNEKKAGKNQSASTCKCVESDTSIKTKGSHESVCCKPIKSEPIKSNKKQCSNSKLKTCPSICTLDEKSKSETVCSCTGEIIFKLTFGDGSNETVQNIKVLKTSQTPSAIEINYHFPKGSTVKVIDCNNASSCCSLKEPSNDDSSDKKCCQLTVSRLERKGELDIANLYQKRDNDNSTLQSQDSSLTCISQVDIKTSSSDTNDSCIFNKTRIDRCESCS